MSLLYFASNSEEKFEEYRRILDESQLFWSRIQVDEPQTMNLERLVEKKLEQTGKVLPNARFFVEHTSLTIHSWNGLPGGLTNAFMDSVGNQGICRMMSSYRGSERSATARLIIGYSDQNRRLHRFFGEVTGSIAPEPRGENGFGWDQIFVPDGDSRTYAEMSSTEKDANSMRGDATGKFARYLQNELSARPANIFVSYAHADGSHWEKFRIQLAVLERQGRAHVWSDLKITGGSEWRKSIQRAMNEADVFLLLLSPDFLSSEFCTGPELQRAMARHRTGEALVIPIMLRECVWEDFSFANLQILPGGAQSIAPRNDLDRAFAGVVRSIGESIESWRLRNGS